MSTGMIAAKYASALLKYVDETGNGEKVYDQICQLDHVLDNSKELRHIVEDPVSITPDKKIEACCLVLGSEPMADELSKFLRLVIAKGRAQYLRLILKSFQERYLKSRNIHIVELTTATPAQDLANRISELLKKKTAGEVIVHSVVDPDIVGGFVLRAEDLLLDASVRSQLDAIKRQFVEKNRRIV